ncbi:hypothetical protein DNU06_16730 [Putridiphycobacter roseus]|uniref:Uncharacterized protein n=1 Tax=Putridiphycobacter roseus TaxID=2219161 RepID=A0A2W1MX12_9FLAO|nr:hypothetical protein [Putridiphycobacter roseus]PZE15690.1 hypothetical protein DNU06_16730 [Putridiphycobacter roseus]
MNVVNLLKNPNVQQNALELLFPIIGFVFFDWSFLVIILFYLTDQLGVEIAYLMRLKFVEKIFLPIKKWLFPIAIVSSVTFFVVEFLWIERLFLTEKFDCSTNYFWLEMQQFLKQEFLFFLPVLVYMNYFKDKMTFYKSKLPYENSPERMLAFQITIYLARLTCVGLVVLLWYIFKWSDLAFVFIIPVLKLIFDAWLMPWGKINLFKGI